MGSFTKTYSDLQHHCTPKTPTHRTLPWRELRVRAGGHASTSSPSPSSSRGQASLSFSRCEVGTTTPTGQGCQKDKLSEVTECHLTKAPKKPGCLLWDVARTAVPKPPSPLLLPPVISKTSLLPCASLRSRDLIYQTAPLLKPARLGQPAQSVLRVPRRWNGPHPATPRVGLRNAAASCVSPTPHTHTHSPARPGV